MHQVIFQAENTLSLVLNRATFMNKIKDSVRIFTVNNICTSKQFAWYVFLSHLRRQLGVIRYKMVRKLGRASGGGRGQGTKSCATLF